MSIEAYMKRVCTDTAVYWGTPTADEYAAYSFTDPVEISCLWKETTEMIRDDAGREIVARAEVWVLQDLDEHGMLYHGELADLNTGEEDDPREILNAYEIKRFLKTPSLHLPGEFNRKVMLL